MAMGNERMNEDDIWFFVDSTVGALSFLEKKVNIYKIL